MRNIKFIIYNYENMIEKIDLVDEKDSLRKKVIKIVNDYVDNTPEEDLKPYFRTLPDNHPFEITIEKNLVHKGYSSYFYLTEDEQIIFMTYYESLEKDWTIIEFENLINNGYITGDLDTIYVSIPSGLGGGWHPEYVVTILTTVSKIILPLLGTYSLNKIKKKIFMRKMKKVAKRWVEKHGVRGAKQIREFIDRKGEWQIERLKKSLNIDEEIAVLFLSSLGYELKGNKWEKSYSENAIEKRKKWEEYSEKNYLY